MLSFYKQSLGTCHALREPPSAGGTFTGQWRRVPEGMVWEVFPPSSPTLVCLNSWWGSGKVPVGLSFSMCKAGGHNLCLSSSGHGVGLRDKAGEGGPGLGAQAEEKGHCHSLHLPSPGLSPARLPCYLPAPISLATSRVRGEGRAPILSPKTGSLLVAGTAPRPHRRRIAPLITLEKNPKPI